MYDTKFVLTHRNTKTNLYRAEIFIFDMNRVAKGEHISKELKDIFINFYNDLGDCANDVSNESQLQKFLIKSCIGIKNYKEKIESEKIKYHDTNEKCKIVTCMESMINIIKRLYWSIADGSINTKIEEFNFYASTTEGALGKLIRRKIDTLNIPVVEISNQNKSI